MIARHWAAAMLAAALAMPQTAAAHDLGVARVELHELEQGRYRLAAKLPPTFEAAPPVLPDRCAVEGEPSAKQRPAVRLLTYEVHCEERPLGEGDVLSLPWEREGAFVAATWSDGSAAGSYFEGRGGAVRVEIDRLRTGRRAGIETASHYLVLGVEHILLGWDHLAFVLGLCLIASGWHLVKRVTAFTLGHSLTLAAAVLGWTRLPSPPVEACIALSIAFVAREALSRHEPSRHGIGLTLAFGLLHGLGFASALADSGIQRSEIFLGLVTFNLGVEVGQLVFVLVVLGVAWLVRRAAPGPGASKNHFTRPATAWALGVLAMFWTLERVLGFAA